MSPSGKGTWEVQADIAYVTMRAEATALCCDAGDEDVFLWKGFSIY